MTVLVTHTAGYLCFARCRLTALSSAMHIASTSKPTTTLKIKEHARFMHNTESSRSASQKLTLAVKFNKCSSGH